MASAPVVGGWDRTRASSLAPVSSTAARKAAESKARSSSTSIPGRSSGSSRRARVASSRSPADRRPADDGAEQGAGAGLDQAHQPQGRVAGEAHPVADAAQPAPVAVGVGHLERVEPSKATVRIPGKHTPGVRGWASGPATISNSALNGAGPSRRRRSRNAFSDGPPPSTAHRRRSGRRRASPRPGRSRAAGTARVRARSTPRPATAGRAAGVARCWSGPARRRPARRGSIPSRRKPRICTFTSSPCFLQTLMSSFRRSSVSGGRGMRMSFPSFDGVNPRSEV